MLLTVQHTLGRPAGKLRGAGGRDKIGKYNEKNQFTFDPEVFFCYIVGFVDAGQICCEGARKPYTYFTICVFKKLIKLH